MKQNVKISAFNRGDKSAVTIFCDGNILSFNADDWPEIQLAVSNEIGKQDNFIFIPFEVYNSLMDYRHKCEKLNKLRQDLIDRTENRHCSPNNLDLIKEILEII